MLERLRAADAVALVSRSEWVLENFRALVHNGRYHFVAVRGWKGQLFWLDPREGPEKISFSQFVRLIQREDVTMLMPPVAAAGRGRRARRRTQRRRRRMTPRRRLTCLGRTRRPWSMRRQLWPCQTRRRRQRTRVDGGRAGAPWRVGARVLSCS